MTLWAIPQPFVTDMSLPSRARIPLNQPESDPWDMPLRAMSRCRTQLRECYGSGA